VGCDDACRTGCTHHLPQRCGGSSVERVKRFVGDEELRLRNESGECGGEHTFSATEVRNGSLEQRADGELVRRGVNRLAHFARGDDPRLQGEGGVIKEAREGGGWRRPGRDQAEASEVRDGWPRLATGGRRDEIDPAHGELPAQLPRQEGAEEPGEGEQEGALPRT